MDWFLYRKPGLTGMVTLRSPGEKARAPREKAANSETLFPVARAMRKRVFKWRLPREEVAVEKRGCSNMERTLFGFQSGMIFPRGGLEMNWERARRENSWSCVLIAKPCRRGRLRAFLYTKMVLGLRWREDAKWTRNWRTVALVMSRCWWSRSHAWNLFQQSSYCLEVDFLWAEMRASATGGENLVEKTCCRKRRRGSEVTSPLEASGVRPAPAGISRGGRRGR